MNKQQAYNTFWGGFGVLAFEENSVPDDEIIAELIKAGVAAAKYPYITYLFQPNLIKRNARRYKYHLETWRFSLSLSRTIPLVELP